MTTEQAHSQSLIVQLAPEVIAWLQQAGQKTNRWNASEYAAWLLAEAYAARAQLAFHYGPEDNGTV